MPPKAQKGKAHADEWREYLTGVDTKKLGLSVYAIKTEELVAYIDYLESKVSKPWYSKAWDVVRRYFW